MINLDKAYNNLSHVPGFARAFPHLMNELRVGNLLVYDDQNNVYPPTDEDNEFIGDLEANLFNEGINATVYAVIKSTMLLSPTEEVRMTAFLYLTDNYDGDQDVMLYESSTYYAFAMVVNHTWHLAEAGSILIEEHNGALRRVG